ncbi:MAG: hypothetical protein EXS67_03850 [Candidatus Margulisbacteria bacterium]|nr:hypothetical protein [Candidatus Margulisiibacteriota bacterium]
MQKQLVALLKKKGTGATMGKSLSSEELALLTECMVSDACHLTTKATILTAFLMLENTESETAWLFSFTAIPPEINFLLTPSALTPFQTILLGVVRGKNLSRTEMQNAMIYFFNPEIPEYEKAIFMEAERLKRENRDENLGCFDALWDRSFHDLVSCPVLVDLSVGYDGFNRTLCLWPFVAPLLASVGVPTVIHGVESVSPKFGVTPHLILKAAGKNPLKTLTEVARDIETPSIGWGYVDQSVSFPELYDLQPLRTHMVKRPVLSTLEKLMQPIRSANGNYVVTGYTHPPYRDTMTHLLNDSAKTHQYMILRGQEGSIQLPLDRRAPIVCGDGEEFVRPETYGFGSDRILPNESLGVQDSLDAGLAVLSGQNQGIQRETIVYLASVILDRFGIVPERSLVEALDSGLALGCFEAF